MWLMHIQVQWFTKHISVNVFQFKYRISFKIFTYHEGRWFHGELTAQNIQIYGLLLLKTVWILFYLLCTNEAKRKKRKRREKKENSKDCFVQTALFLSITNRKKKDGQASVAGYFKCALSTVCQEDISP